MKKNRLSSSLAPRIAVAASLVLDVHLALAGPPGGALKSGTYRTTPGTTVEERGDRVPDEIRRVPISATLTLDLTAAPPSVTAVISNAVLEGGNPFALTVRSSSGDQLSDGTYRFSGDYLRDIQPSGTQYLFDWSFSPSTDGGVVWNGIAGWAGGHLWQVTLSDLALVAVPPRLEIARTGSQVTVSWSAAATGYVLEQAGNLAAPEWSPVTEGVVRTGDQFSIAVEAGDLPGFLRLRKL